MHHSVYAVTPMKIAFAVSMVSAAFSAFSTSCTFAVLKYCDSHLAVCALYAITTMFLLYTLFDLAFKTLKKAAKGNALKYVPSLSSAGSSLCSCGTMFSLHLMTISDESNLMRSVIIGNTLASAVFTGFMFAIVVIVNNDIDGRKNKNLLSTTRDEKGSFPMKDLMKDLKE